MTREQYLDLRDLLAKWYMFANSPVKCYPPTAKHTHAMEFIQQAAEDFLDEPADLIERARAEHANDDVEVDDDAPLRRTGDGGTWVGGWLWVPYPDEDA